MDLSTGGLKAFIRILRGDATSAAVWGDGWVVHSKEVDLGVHRRIQAIEPQEFQPLNNILPY